MEQNEWTKQRRSLFTKCGASNQGTIWGQMNSPEKGFDEEWKEYCHSLKYEYFKHSVISLILVLPCYAAVWYFFGIAATIIAHLIIKEIFRVADEYNDTRNNVMHVWNAFQLKEQIEQLKEERSEK